MAPAVAGARRPLARTPLQAYAHLVATDERKDTDDVGGAAVAATGATAEHEEDALDPLGMEEEPPSQPSGPAPPEAAELAAACVRYVASRYGATLDYAPDTLSFVDQWLRDARADVGERPEAVLLVQGAAGAYLGEVIRRTFGGEWLVAEDQADWRLMLTRVYCAFNPIGMAREALLLEGAEGWHAHFELDPAEREAAEARLAALPAVEDDEFYAPSTRFDVVSILFHALRAGMQSRGLADVRFGHQDYA